jgi:hypothetical protein
MGREQLEALLHVLEHQLSLDKDNLALGTWDIRYDKEQQAFHFDKCENEGYCEERPAIIGLDGSIIDKGGPLFG